MIRPESKEPAKIVIERVKKSRRYKNLRKMFVDWLKLRSKKHKKLNEKMEWNYFLCDLTEGIRVKKNR